MPVSTSNKINSDKILIIDFGGQYTHLISRRIRDMGGFADLIPVDSLQEVDINCKGIILSGGPRSVGKANMIEVPTFLKAAIHDPSIPVLGICYGHQLLGYITGGNVKHSEMREYGRVKISVVENGVLTPDAKQFDSWMSHGDHVDDAGPGYTITGVSDNCPVASMENHAAKTYGVQFHPEVTHTEYGDQILSKFVFDICGLSKTSWDLPKFVETLIRDIRRQVGDSKVLLGVSGGVDSTVAATIIHKAIGDNLHCVFVDHGLLRKKEVEEVSEVFRENLDIKNFHVCSSSHIFLSKLAGLTDPEEKRKAIGHTFIEVFEAKAKELESDFGIFKFLAQGTIYSDRIESGAVGAKSEKIKSHHNLTLPEGMALHLLEPLKDLYKDEVRNLGRILELPEAILMRYPFPGPGLAVRIIGEVTENRLKTLQEADYIFQKMIIERGHFNDVWQGFAVLFPINAVGVQGDNRAYGNIIALRAVQSREGMTADVVKFPWEFLTDVASTIINEIEEITRVVYDLSTKPPGTIEFE